MIACGRASTFVACAPRWYNVYHGRPDKCRNAYIKRGPGVFEHCVYKESMRIWKSRFSLLRARHHLLLPAFMPERVLVSNVVEMDTRRTVL